MSPLSSSSSCSKPHIVLFPFMSKGHTIPLLQLAQLLLERDVAVTVFTTPEGAESTDKLPSMAHFLSFAQGIKLMQPAFEQELQKIHSQVSCIISDGFLHWTLESASRFGIPQLSFLGTNYYASEAIPNAVANGLLSLHESDDEPFTLPGFPWIQLTRNDFGEPMNKRDLSGPQLEFILDTIRTTEASYGLLVNSFYELEQIFADYCSSSERRPRTWSIGPLCLAKLNSAHCHY